MFAPHLSKIKIERTEPSPEEVERAKGILKRRFERLATAAVIKDKIDSEKTTDQIRKAERKVQNSIDFDERKIALRHFIENFNKWRRYFADRVDDWRPKTMSQLRMIEKIVHMIRENDLDADVFIACSFWATKRWKVKVPGFNHIYSRGLEWYDSYYEDVLAEIDSNEAYDQ